MGCPPITKIQENQAISISMSEHEISNKQMHAADCCNSDKDP